MIDAPPGNDSVPGWVPEWPLPPNVMAWATERGPGDDGFGGFNLGLHVGDDPTRVMAHRERLQRHCGGLPIQWLTQVHGTRVHRLEASTRPEWGGAQAPQADALYSDRPGSALAIMTADCLPVLLCDDQGREIAAVHAGWRGLAAGILHDVVAAFRARPEQLSAWLGAAICARHFEVGQEVYRAFVDSPAFREQSGSVRAAFSPAQRAGHYDCDLYALARACLRDCGLARIYGGTCCTWHQPERFYSYRREGVCGRMATVIALR